MVTLEPIAFWESQFIKYTGYIPSYNLVTCCLLNCARKSGAIRILNGFFCLFSLFYKKMLNSFFFSFSPSNLVSLWIDNNCTCSLKAIHSSDRSFVLPRRRNPCVDIIPSFQFFYYSACISIWFREMSKGSVLLAVKLILGIFI